MFLMTDPSQEEIEEFAVTLTGKPSQTNFAILSLRRTYEQVLMGAELHFLRHRQIDLNDSKMLDIL